MNRRRLPEDANWTRDYLRRAGLKITPAQAMEEFSEADWRQLRAAWTRYRRRLEQGHRYCLRARSWKALERMCRRHYFLDMDELVAFLALEDVRRPDAIALDGPRPSRLPRPGDD